MDDNFKPINGMTKFNLDIIRTDNLVDRNFQRIYNDSVKNTENLVNIMSEQKQEEKRQKERDSRNIEITAKNSEEIKELLSSMNRTLDMIINKIGAEAQLSLSEQKQMNKLLFEIKDIILTDEEDDEKESKLLGIMKQGISVGKQAGMMLFLEYLKFKAKQYGLPMT